MTRSAWIAPAPTEPTDEPYLGDDVTILKAFLDWQRHALLTTCAGLTGEQLARRSVPPSTLSLLGLVRHMSKVERTWFRQRVAGEPIEALFEGRPKDTDFDAVEPSAAEQELARYHEECRAADAAVSGLPLDTTFVLRGRVYSLRFVYVHMIAEYARHAGHADLLREQIDGTRAS